MARRGKKESAGPKERKGGCCCCCCCCGKGSKVEDDVIEPETFTVPEVPEPAPAPPPPPPQYDLDGDGRPDLDRDGDGIDDRMGMPVALQPGQIINWEGNFYVACLPPSQQLSSSARLPVGSIGLVWMPAAQLAPPKPLKGNRK